MYSIRYCRGRNQGESKVTSEIQVKEKANLEREAKNRGKAMVAREMFKGESTPIARITTSRTDTVTETLQKRQKTCRRSSKGMEKHEKNLEPLLVSLKQSELRNFPGFGLRRR